MSNAPASFNHSGFGGQLDQTRYQQFALSSSVLLTTVLCLMFVIVLITILHLYARYLLRRQQAQRRRPQSQFHYRSAHAAIAPLTVERPKTGLDAEVVATLPKFVYKKNDQDQSEGAAAAAVDECSVCLSPLEEGETVRQLPPCGHTFHDNCIDMWLYSHNTCPLCRKVVDPIANYSPAAAASATVEVVISGQVGGGAGSDYSSSQATSSQLLFPSAAAACGGSSGQGDFGHEEFTPSPLTSFRRMFSLDRAGGRRQQQGDEGAHRDLERQ